MLSQLTDVVREKPQQQVRLGITWLFEPTINFYRKTRKMEWLLPVTRDGVKGSYDFYYIEKDDLDLDTTQLLRICKFDVSQSQLFRKAGSL